MGREVRINPGNYADKKRFAVRNTPTRNTARNSTAFARSFCRL
jgi:hypothetical protein